MAKRKIDLRLTRDKRYTQPLPPDWFPSEDRRWWFTDDVTHAVVASVKGKPIGVFRFRMCERKLYGYGSFVLKRWRKKGVARLMWEWALFRLKVEHAVYEISSAEGAALLAALVRVKPEIQWEIYGDLMP